MSERKASMGDKIYRGDAVNFIRNNISLGTFMKRTVKTADEACWDLCDKLNYVPAIKENPKPHWIPVEQELPEQDKICLVCGKNGGIYVARFWRNENLVLWTKTGTGKFVNAVAWMPLPEPYKVVTE